MEAKYIAAPSAICEAIWLWKLVVEFINEMLESTVIYCDNKSCIELSENPLFHEQYKHINIRYHFLADRVQRRALILEYILSNSLVTNNFDEAPAKGKFELPRDKLGVVEKTFLAKREC
jgi:hypothetical protein